MEISVIKWPLYAKLSIILMGIVSFFYIMYIGQDIIVPFIFSTIIAILLNPIVSFMLRFKINRLIAIILTELVAIIIGSVAYFIISQAARLSDSFPQFQQKFTVILSDFIGWLSNNLGIAKPKIYAWLDKTKAASMNTSSIVGSALSSVRVIIVVLLFMPVYIFMILFYKPLLLAFLAQLFKNKKQTMVAEILIEIKSLVQSYLVGLLIEAAVVGTLNSLGLLILHIQYAILLGVIGALVNVIPYIGGIIATSLPMLMAVATKDPIAALWVLVVYLAIQLIDNNYIFPRIVASKVKMNALISIIVVLIGGALWGIAGTFLALPLTAICKVIFDRIPALKPFGFLLGDNRQEIKEFSFKPKRNYVKRNGT